MGNQLPILSVALQQQLQVLLEEVPQVKLVYSEELGQPRQPKVSSELSLRLLDLQLLSLEGQLLLVQPSQPAHLVNLRLKPLFSETINQLLLLKRLYLANLSPKLLLKVVYLVTMQQLHQPQPLD